MVIHPTLDCNSSSFFILFSLCFHLSLFQGIQQQEKIIIHLNKRFQVLGSPMKWTEHIASCVTPLTCEDGHFNKHTNIELKNYIGIKEDEMISNLFLDLKKSSRRSKNFPDYKRLKVSYSTLMNASGLGQFCFFDNFKVHSAAVRPSRRATALKNSSSDIRSLLESSAVMPTSRKIT